MSSYDPEIDAQIEEQLMYLISQGKIKWEKDLKSTCPSAYQATYNGMTFRLRDRSSCGDKIMVTVEKKDDYRSYFTIWSARLYEIWKAMHDHEIAIIREEEKEKKKGILEKMKSEHSSSG